jgi:hypothetical protein
VARISNRCFADGTDEERWRAVQTGAEIAIILPAFILFAGAGFFWAFRGFQDRQR